MMKPGVLLAAGMLAAIVSGSAVAQPARIEVVASFSILADMTARIGGDRVSIRTIVGPGADAHVFEPTPSTARTLAGAHLLVVNGLGFELFLPRLVAAAGYGGATVVASQGVVPLDAAEDHDHAGHDHDHGAFDPHAWQDMRNALVYVDNIAAGLCTAAPADCPTFEANAAAYRTEIAALDADIRAQMAALPADRRTVITTHDAFRYFGAAYDVNVMAIQGVSTDAEASAADLVRLIGAIRAAGAVALFYENIAAGRLIDQISREAGIPVGGTLYSDALTGPGGEAPNYLAMMRANADRIAAVLGR